MIVPMVVIMPVIVIMVMRMIVMCRQNSGDGFHARHPQRHRFADFAQTFRRGGAVRRHFQHKTDMAVFDHQALDHVLLYHGAAADGVHHLVQRLKHIVAKVCHGRSI